MMMFWADIWHVSVQKDQCDQHGMTQWEVIRNEAEWWARPDHIDSYAYH